MGYARQLPLAGFLEWVGFASFVSIVDIKGQGEDRPFGYVANLTV